MSAEDRDVVPLQQVKLQVVWSRLTDLDEGAATLVLDGRRLHTDLSHDWQGWSVEGGP